MSQFNVNRRTALAGAAAAATAVTLLTSPAHAGEAAAEDVSATEDLMREHGVLRRILVVYRECAATIRSGGTFEVAALADAANLFRAFGEDYHERKLEEQHVFPAVKKAGGPASNLIDTLVAQHDRGREINVFLIDVCRSGVIASANREHVVRALESFARMYEKHAAMEDTVIFQAWKRSLSASALRDASEEFETIEREQFKGDGFDIGVAHIATIEQRLGITDLRRYTAPPPV